MLYVFFLDLLFWRYNLYSGEEEGSLLPCGDCTRLSVPLWAVYEVEGCGEYKQSTAAFRASRTFFWWDRLGTARKGGRDSVCFASSHGLEMS